MIYFSNTLDVNNTYGFIQETQEDNNTTTTNQIEKEKKIDSVFEFSSNFQLFDSVNSNNKSPGIN